MNKINTLLIIAFCCLFFSLSALSSEAENPSLSIGGLVQSPMQLTLHDLLQFKQKAISAYKDVNQKGNRIARYGATPLRSVLELAKIQKMRDFAISVKNNNGEQIVLSWEEVSQSARDRIFIAGSSSPGDSSFHQDLPALIIERNNKAYLSLRKIVFIEAIDISQYKSEPKKSLDFSTVAMDPVSIQGCTLTSVLDKIALTPGQTDVLYITAKNRNAVISLQELESGAVPTVVPREMGNGKEANYDLVFPGDSAGARRLESIDCIEIVSLKQNPMLYVVGVGCGDPNLLTNEAISIMGKADAFIGKDDYQKTFAGYIAGKPVLFDPFLQLARYQKSKRPELTDSEAEKIANTVYADNIQTIRKAFKEGKIVALLEPGDPALYGGWRNWLSEYIPKEQIRVIAGMSSFSAANALLGEYDITRHPVIIAEPEELKSNEQLIQTAAQNGNVIVVFMGLNRMKALAPLLGKYFPQDTPLIIVYYAGMAGKERRIQTSLSKAIETTVAAQESFLGLIYIGRDLKESEKTERR
jgi:precorrin-4/cobalt-precorrin-4 C11-methyltransferase